MIHKIIFSMLGRYAAEESARRCSRLRLRRVRGEHRYGMVLHTDEPHPHVHVAVKAASEAGVRLNLRRQMLWHWPQEFARQRRPDICPLVRQSVYSGLATWVLFFRALADRCPNTLAYFSNRSASACRSSPLPRNICLRR
jgi:hypothetical protein